jgi:predicted RNA-binding protein with PIN domain
MVTVVVDAENVRRSTWPNVSGERLVELVRRWAEERGHDYLVVFEGEDESADDRIARVVADLDRYWLVTSDRELRRRAGEGAERVIGGGSFIRELTAAD